MKLQKVEIQNYKSIINTTVDIGVSDRILSLIGQNESGKSSILEALRDYYDGEFDEDSMPFESPEDTDQKVTCTFIFESVGEKNDILQKIKAFASKDIYGEPIKIKKNIFDKITGFSIMFDGENYTFSENFRTILSNNIDFDSEGVEGKPEKEIDGNALFSDLEQYFLDELVPEFIFFNGGECDTLPDFISIESLVSKKGDGWQSVVWLEKCLQEITNDPEFNFNDLLAVGSISRRSSINNKVSEITADFKKDFTQKIHGIDYDKLGIEFNLEKRKEEGDTIDKDYIDFAVKTKEGKALPVRMRSQGMIWFLSFWLALKSLKEKKSIVLVDEPDKSLHINAQNDLLKVFEKISEKFGHQIIYATHAPSLVPLDKIYRVYIVFNDKDQGTLCESILKTHIGDSKNKQEAISLVNYAIGCEVPHKNLIFKEKNVILEGFSDFMHLQAMANILNKKLDYALIPGVGAKGSKLNPLVGICIGYNLKWCVILDGETIGQNKFEELKEGIFAGNQDKAEKKIKVLNVPDIEELFSISDIQTISNGSYNFTLPKKPSKKDNVSYIGKDRKNIFAKLFLEKSINKKIKKGDLGKTVLKSFEDIFDFIETALKEDILD